MLLWLVGGAARADEPAVTVLADFEDPSFAANITSVRNVLAGDCAAQPTTVPARGRGALAVEVGATQPGASVACDLTFRETMRFRQADRAVTFCWLNEGEMQLGFRVHDARDQFFETELQKVATTRRWVRLAADLSPERLKRVRGDGPLTYPIEVEGYRVATQRVGKQTIFLDDLQVEHRLAARELVHGGFRFTGAVAGRESSRIYQPGATVAAAVVLENRSHERTLDLAVDLAWMRPDGATLQKQTSKVNLPASGVDYRSTQTIDFPQVLRDPGLYRVVARARAPGWPAASTFETSVAVIPSSRRLSRGNSTFFGVQTNLLREPALDQQLELSVARDVGVNLLALETSWRQIEPKSGRLDFAALDALVHPLTDNKEMAAMLVLGDPPEWVGNDAAARVEALTRLVVAVTQHFGARIERCELGADVLGVADVAEQLERVAQVRAGVAQQPSALVVVPPPIKVTDRSAAPQVAALAQAHPDWPLIFRTAGDASAAPAQLEAFRNAGGFAWQPTHVWLHEAEPVVGSGFYFDAEVVLRCYVQAAAAGLGGLIWFDLRDDDNDAAHPELLRGLVRRDFSPKTSLLGYAAAAGQLTGYRYAGPVGAPPELFDSALFIGGNRQVAVLLARPNRLLPATLALTQAVPGDVDAQDFERRPYALLAAGTRRLVPTSTRPIFVTLTLNHPESEPKLALTPSWLHVPATAFCQAAADFTIELHAAEPTPRGYWQLQLPKDPPFESSFSAAALHADAGETIRQTVRLTPRTPARDFDHQPIALRVALNGDSFDVPLDVQPLVDVTPLASGERVAEPKHRLAEASVPGGRRTATRMTVHGAYQPGTFHLSVTVDDPHLVLYRLTESGRPTGDLLRLGVACEGADGHAEVCVAPAAREPRIEPLSGTHPEQISAWRFELTGSDKDVTRTYNFSIPSGPLGAEKLAPGGHLLLAVQYTNDDADGLPPVPITWGGGLDGSRSTTDYRWVRLAPPAGN